MTTIVVTELQLISNVKVIYLVKVISIAEPVYFPLIVINKKNKVTLLVFVHDRVKTVTLIQIKQL